MEEFDYIFVGEASGCILANRIGASDRHKVLEFVRRNGQTTYHPIGTCRINPA